MKQNSHTFIRGRASLEDCLTPYNDKYEHTKAK